MEARCFRTRILSVAIIFLASSPVLRAQDAYAAAEVVSSRPPFSIDRQKTSPKSAEIAASGTSQPAPMFHFTADGAGMATVRITAKDGSVVNRAMLSVEQGANVVAIPELEKLQAGAYTLTIIYPGGISYHEHTVGR